MQVLSILYFCFRFSMCEERPIPHKIQNFKLSGMNNEKYRDKVESKDKKSYFNVNPHDYEMKSTIKHKVKNYVKHESNSVSFSENLCMTSNDLINNDERLVGSIKGINQASMSINFDPILNGQAPITSEPEMFKYNLNKDSTEYIVTFNNSMGLIDNHIADTERIKIINSKQANYSYFPLLLSNITFSHDEITKFEAYDLKIFIPQFEQCSIFTIIFDDINLGTFLRPDLMLLSLLKHEIITKSFPLYISEMYKNDISLIFEFLAECVSIKKLEGLNEKNIDYEEFKIIVFEILSNSKHIRKIFESKDKNTTIHLVNEPNDIIYETIVERVNSYLSYHLHYIEDTYRAIAQA